MFGLGLVTFVAPLTATVMGSVDRDHVSVASGVNNAIARTASLAPLAVIPVDLGPVGRDRRGAGHRTPSASSLVIAAGRRRGRRARSASSASVPTSAPGGARAVMYCAGRRSAAPARPGAVPRARARGVSDRR